MENIAHRMNPRGWMIAGFVLTTPCVLFWCLVAYTKIFHDHRYIDTILSCGGSFCDIFIKSAFPFASLLIAVICNKALRQDAITKNVWHRETKMMRLNRGLINWNAILILVMILSLINN
jgi:hypothetical protein